MLALALAAMEGPNMRNLPLGFRFFPQEIELMHYIKNKNLGCYDFIPEYDIYQCTPDQLPHCDFTNGEERYFYVSRDPEKARQGRSVGRDYFWRSTGSGLIEYQEQVIGHKTNLVFRRKGIKNPKTEWMMNEYSLASEGETSSATNAKNKKIGEFVLCKIYKKVTKASSNSVEEATMHFNEHTSEFWSLEGLTSMLLGED